MRDDAGGTTVTALVVLISKGNLGEFISQGSHDGAGPSIRSLAFVALKQNISISLSLSLSLPPFPSFFSLILTPPAL